MKLRVRLLGAFEVWRDGALIAASEWHGQKPRDLLKVLTLARGRYVSQDQLADWLWPDAPSDQAKVNLRSAVSDLRKALEPELTRGRDSAFVLTRREGYAFNLEAPISVDVIEFERAIGPTAGRQELEEALTLYRGDLLEEDPYAEWAQAERRRLSELRLEVLARLADLCLAEGDFAAAIQRSEQALALDSGREAVWRGLMEAQAAKGDRAAALRSFDRCRAALARELGVDPTPETAALHERILRDDRQTVAIVVAPRLAVPREPHWLYRLGAGGSGVWVLLTSAALVASLAGVWNGTFVSRGDPGAEALPFLAANPEALGTLDQQVLLFVPLALLLAPAYLAGFAWLRSRLRDAGKEAGLLAWGGLGLGLLDVAAQTLSRAVGLAQMTVLPTAYTSAPPGEQTSLIALWDVLRQLASAFGIISAVAGPLAVGLLCWAGWQGLRRPDGVGAVWPWFSGAGIGLSMLTLVYGAVAPGGTLLSLWFHLGLSLTLGTLAWFGGLAWLLWQAGTPAQPAVSRIPHIFPTPSH